MIKAKIKKILKLLDDSQFKKVIELCGHLDSDIFPKKLYQNIAKLMEREVDGAYAWRDYLNTLAKKNNAEILFTTFREKNGFDFSTILQKFSKNGDGLLRIGQNVEFVTFGEQQCSLIYKLPENSRKNITVHFLASFYSNVNNNFYLTLKGQTEEAFRFSNYYVALCRDGSTLTCNTKVPKLYTVAISENSVSLFSNGILQKRKFREKNSGFDELIIKLIGSPAADLSGIMYGIEIWSGKSPFRGFSKNDEKIVLMRAEEGLREKKVQRVFELLSSIDGIKVDRWQKEILALLEKQLNGRGFQEWIFNTLFQKVSQNVKNNWKRIYIKKIPKPLLEVEHLTVEFLHLPHKRFSLKHLILRKRIEKFNVLDDINFRVYPGDILGIIGANGAGKSTLLKTIAGLVPIKNGRIVMRGGHLLLSPGLGVRNELTGRENIYLAGYFMGLTKQKIDRLFEEIVEFSELKESIDKPFKFYSDGMKSRLIFSLATSVSPEILMLDELLSAGDIKFQQKAAQRMEELLNKAKVVIVVTHSLPFVSQKCNKALFLSGGKQVYYGEPKTAITYYLNELHIPSKELGEDISALNLSAAQQIQQQASLPTGMR